VPVFFHTGSAPGIHPSEDYLPEGIRDVSARKDPHTVSPSGAPAAEAPGRPDRPRFLGFDPSRSSQRSGKGLACWPLEPPLGSTLLGFSGEGLGRDFARPPLTRFSDPALAGTAGAPECQSTFARPCPGAVPEYGPDKATLLGFLHLLTPGHANESATGLWVHLALCRALLPTSQCS
jgi:hypothetical protein